VTHAQTWASYSAVYQFRSLSRKYIFAILKSDLYITAIGSRSRSWEQNVHLCILFAFDWNAVLLYIVSVLSLLKFDRGAGQ